MGVEWEKTTVLRSALAIKPLFRFFAITKQHKLLDTPAPPIMATAPSAHLTGNDS